MQFREVCQDVVRDTVGALGCFVIDLRTGYVVASSSRDDAILADLNLRSVIRSSEQMYRGKLIKQFSLALPTNRPSINGFVKEVQITRSYSYQFMAAMPTWNDGILVLITEKTLSIGFGWMIVHEALERLATAGRDAPGDQRQPTPEASESTEQVAAEERQVSRPEPADVPVQPRPQVISPPAMETPAPAAPSAERGPQSPAVAGPAAPTTPGDVPAAAAPMTEDVHGNQVPPPPTTEAASTPVSAALPDAQPESKAPVQSGPRAKMFRPRNSRKNEAKRRSP